MSDKIKDGGPAFPKDHGYYDSGMSLRDYFAIHATREDIEQYLEYDLDFDTHEGAIPHPIKDDSIPAARYKFADVMLEAREK